MKRHLSCMCLVLALGPLACSPPPHPYRQKLESWSPSPEEKVQLEGLTREYVLKRGLLNPEELAHITVEACDSGWIRLGIGKKMIGISITDRRLLPDNIDELADGIIRREAARIALVLVDATDRQVLQVTLHESRRRGVGGPGPAGFSGTPQYVPATGELAKTCRAIIPRLKVARTVPNHKPCESLEAAKALIWRHISMAAPPGRCTEYEGWYLFSGGDRSTVDDGTFRSGLAVKKGTAEIHRWEQRQPAE